MEAGHPQNAPVIQKNIQICTVSWHAKHLTLYLSPVGIEETKRKRFAYSLYLGEISVWGKIFTVTMSIDTVNVPVDIFYFY